MVEEESVGVRIANSVCIGCNIDDTIWYDDTTTMADEIDIELEKAEKKGRVEGEIKEMRDTLTTLKAIDSELDRRNVDMMLKTLIKVKEKRLKNLESEKV